MSTPISVAEAAFAKPLPDDQRLAWGVIGTGSIAGTFAEALKLSATGKLVAVGSRAKASAEKFGAKWGCPAARCYGSYDELLADPEVKAVYVATPHPQHAEWAIKCAEAGKHVLCEKPLGVNFHEAAAIVEAAVANNVFLMEAFMYRCAPQTAELVRLIREERAVGDVRVIQATFSFHAGYNEASRILANDLAGGGILDVGCYPVSMSRLIAGAAAGKDFADPAEVKGVAHLGKTGVDEWAVGSLKFPGDVVAQVATGVQVNQENVVRIFGSEGNLFIPMPWVPAREGGTSKMVLTRKGEKTPREITVESPRHIYAIEADVVGLSVAAGRKQAPAPAMTWDDTLGNLRALDAWRSSVGLVYDFEKPQQAKPVTVANRPLKARASHNMKYGRIAHLDKPVSRLVMGVDNQNTWPHAGVMFDDFFERGGNAFDTAWIYGPAKSQLMGTWMKSRNVRDQVVLIGKGAHTPFCTPRDLTRQLHESLGHLQTDFVDIYMMHRDNPEVPVGEFVDVLNEHVRAGRIKTFGGSNWTPARVDEANAYAKAKGLQGFSVVSNNFSLARMLDVIWAGCVTSSDAASRQWFADRQIALLPWSSQARGFFVPGRAAPDKRDDAELVRCWYSDDNFQRLARATELAKKYGVSPINIALAYVLRQPFPTFPLIGPRQLSETRTSLPALDVELTEQEVRWLNLEA